MQAATFFQRQCPTCGRPLQIRIQLLGKSICCPHCEAEFIATACGPRPSDSEILDRVELLLSENEPQFAREWSPNGDIL